MPARAGKTTYVPGVGSTTQGKSGAAKKFTGKGPGPSGTTKVAEPTIETVPVITVSPSGKTTTANFKSQTAATRAKRQARATKRKTRAILRSVSQSEQKPPVKAELPKRLTPDVGAPVTKAVKAVAAAPKVVMQAINEGAAAAAKLPEQKTTKAFGKPTLGTPKVKEVVKAGKEGRLQVKGKVSTPQARKAKKELKRARKVYAKKATPRISGLRNQAQEEFAESLSKSSKIPPKLAGEWTLQESGATSAGAGGEAGEQNQLGVGYPAHPTAMSQSPYFNGVTPKKAGENTTKWLEGKIGGEYDYKAADSIVGISKLAKSGASEDEIRHYIEGPSAWGTGTIAQSGVTATPGKAGPKVTARLKTAKKQAQKLGIPTGRPSPEQQHVNYLKVFGKQVGRQLKLVKAGKVDKGPGKLVLDSGTDITYGHEPEIAARLKLLAAKIGKPVYVISGHRTPQHSVEVGGFANDPHTEGKAADIGIGSALRESAGEISEAEYESVGLHRPYYPESAAEINHVELLNGGTPSTGSGAGRVTATVTGSGSIPASAISTYAQATGSTPAAVKRRLKARKLTTAQILKKLETLGVGTLGTASAVSQGEPVSANISALEQKYGKATV